MKEKLISDIDCLCQWIIDINSSMEDVSDVDETKKRIELMELTINKLFKELDKISTNQLPTFKLDRDSYIHCFL